MSLEALYEPLVERPRQTEGASGPHRPRAPRARHELARRAVAVRVVDGAVVVAVDAAVVLMVLVIVIVIAVLVFVRVLNAVCVHVYVQVGVVRFVIALVAHTGSFAAPRGLTGSPCDGATGPVTSGSRRRIRVRRAYAERSFEKSAICSQYEQIFSFLSRMRTWCRTRRGTGNPSHSARPRDYYLGSRSSVALACGVALRAGFGCFVGVLFTGKARSGGLRYGAAV